MTLSPMPRSRLILNGKSAGNDAVRDAVAALRDSGVRLDVRVTWEHGDAERYVAEATEDGADTVIAGGGLRWACCHSAPPTTLALRPASRSNRKPP